MANEYGRKDRSGTAGPARFIIATAAGASVFSVDLLFPESFAVSGLYAAVVLFAGQDRSPSALIAALVATALTAVAWLVHDDTGVGRLAGLAVVWASAISVRERRSVIGATTTALRVEEAEHRETRAHLGRTADFLENLIDSSPDMTIATDADACIVEFNPAAEATFGLTRACALGRPFCSLFGDAARGEAVYAGILAGDGRGDAECRKGSGERFPCSLSGSALLDEAGGVVGVMIVCKDVTLDRETAAKAKRQGQLVAVGQLAAGIAHDFNNILTVIMATAQILSLREDTPPKIKAEVESISKQADAAARLIRQVLDFSRQTVIQHAPIDVVAVYKETIRLLERTLPETIAVRTDLQVERCVLTANPAQLQEAVTNLAVNARDAMPRGGEIRFGLRTLSAIDSPVEIKGWTGAGNVTVDDGDWAVLSVQDTGEGMSPEVMARIFEPFFTTKPIGHGTGLGMAQVYGILKQHEGFVDVESAPGRGTTVSLYFPVVAEGVPEAEGAPPGIVEGRGHTVLVVEDDVHVLAIVADLLVGLGYRVIRAGSPEIALSKFKRHRDDISLTLTDMVMPHMDGLELADTLRSMDVRIPVVIMTGYSAKVDSPQSLPGYIAAVIEKPIRVQELSDAVAGALQRGVS